MCKALCAACLQQSITVLGSVGWNLEFLYQISPCWCGKANGQSLAVFRAKIHSGLQEGALHCCLFGSPVDIQADARVVHLLRRWEWRMGSFAAVWVELLKNLTVWFEKRSLNWVIFLTKNCFAPAKERFSSWEELSCSTSAHTPPPSPKLWWLFDTKECYNLASSMGRPVLPRCGEALLLHEAGVLTIATLSLHGWP